MAIQVTAPDVVGHPAAQDLLLRAYRLSLLHGTAPLLSYFFHIPARIISSRHRREMERELPAGANPWEHYRFLITSVDYAKQPAIKNQILEQRWNTVSSAEAQKVLYDGHEPLAIADFYYDPRIVVFVDGSPHHRDYIQAADDRQRRRLKALNYRVVVIQAGDMEAGLDDLAERLGV